VIKDLFRCCTLICEGNISQSSSYLENVLKNVVLNQFSMENVPKSPAVSKTSANFSAAKDLAFAFHNLTVLDNNKVLLTDVSGYVRDHCITAVIGASASGKSLMLQALAGQTRGMDVSGHVYMSGREVDPKDRTNPIAYVPQDDNLIGELTVREMTRDTAYLRRGEKANVLDRDIGMLLMRMGLDDVSDCRIGTPTHVSPFYYRLYTRRWFCCLLVSVACSLDVSRFLL
jgi:ABC-type Fe3+/spermidine/putrescine transport system ATPase subunit